MPDPPGLFDGHVWPMYLKHRRLMEDSNLSVGMLKLFSLLGLKCVQGLFSHICLLVCADYLDGMKTKEEIYNQVYEDIQNNFLNHL